MINRLDASIPANNWKIIELYNKIKKEELDPSPAFQRKLVWKKAHKYKFIETILMNYPFPEIYIAPGKLDTERLELKDLIVDGQQRCRTIENYIDGRDVFANNLVSVPKFSDLSREEKESFLNYEVSVRYLKNASDDNITEIFQRINSTEYALNTTERLNAKWGDSEFICFVKQLIEQDIDIDFNLINYKINKENREFSLNFFLEKYVVFTENDINRMLAMQYLLTLMSTLIDEKYFKRNDRVQYYIELYNEEFRDASDVEINFKNTLEFIDKLELNPKSYWFNKANLFTLIVELYKYDLDVIDLQKLKERLISFEQDYKIYSMNILRDSQRVENLLPLVVDDAQVTSPDQIRYFEYAREAVNEVVAREYRGAIVSAMIEKSISIIE